MVEERPAVFDHPGKDLVHGPFSESRILIEFADELPAQRPYVVDVF